MQNRMIMRATIKLYFKSFLISGLLFGSILTLLEYFDTKEIDILKHLLQGIIFGVIMSWITVIVQKSVLRKYSLKNNEQNLNVRQCTSVENRIGIDRLSKTLKEKEFSQNWKLKESESIIVVETNISWRSWGEKIRIEYSSDRIIIKSRPKIITTMFDFGQNYINVQNIKKLIEEYDGECPAHNKS